MATELELAANSTGLVAGVSSALTIGGLALMRAVREYSSSRKDNAADRAEANTYSMLAAENKRLADQMTQLSMLVNESMGEKLKPMARVGELERQLHGMADMEKENEALRKEVAEIREENHSLRDKVHTLELQMKAR